MAAKKTGALFAAAAEGAAMLATDDPSVRGSLGRFGDAFGQAFQAHDDLLGIWASAERTGKVEMNDLTKRKKTLPVVLAFEREQGGDQAATAPGAAEIGDRRLRCQYGVLALSGHSPAPWAEARSLWLPKALPLW